MRWTGVTRKDVARGSEHYIGQARTLLGMVQARIDNSNGLLKQYQMVQKFKDGTRIFAQVVGEQRLIKIWWEELVEKVEKFLECHFIAHYYDQNWSDGYFQEEEPWDYLWSDIELKETRNKGELYPNDGSTFHGPIDWVSLDGKIILTFNRYNHGHNRYTSIGSGWNYGNDVIYWNKRKLCTTPTGSNGGGVIGVSVYKGKIICVGRISSYTPIVKYFYVSAPTFNPADPYPVIEEEDWIEFAEFDLEAASQSMCNFRPAGDQGVFVHYKADGTRDAITVTLEENNGELSANFAVIKTTEGFEYKNVFTYGSYTQTAEETFVDTSWWKNCYGYTTAGIGTCLTDIIEECTEICPVHHIDTEAGWNVENPYDYSITPSTHCIPANVSSIPPTEVVVSWLYEEHSVYVKNSSGGECLDDYSHWCAATGAYQLYYSETAAISNLIGNTRVQTWKGSHVVYADYKEGEVIFAIETHDYTITDGHNAYNKVIGASVRNPTSINPDDVGAGWSPPDGKYQYSGNYKFEQGVDHGLKIDGIDQIIPLDGYGKKGSYQWESSWDKTIDPATGSMTGDTEDHIYVLIYNLDMRYSHVSYSDWTQVETFGGGLRYPDDSYPDNMDLFNSNEEYKTDIYVIINNKKQTIFSDSYLNDNTAQGVAFCKSTVTKDDEHYDNTESAVYTYKTHLASCPSSACFMSFVYWSYWGDSDIDMVHTAIYDAKGTYVDPYPISGLPSEFPLEDDGIGGSISNIGHFEDISII